MERYEISKRTLTGLIANDLCRYTAIVVNEVQMYLIEGVSKGQVIYSIDNYLRFVAKYMDKVAIVNPSMDNVGIPIAGAGVFSLSNIYAVSTNTLASLNFDTISDEEFGEFMKYYNELKDYIQSKFTKHEYVFVHQNGKTNNEEEE